jgi:cell division protein FtsB
MGKGLRTSLIGMGLFFICLGIFLNFQLYTSLAGNGALYEYSYGVIGIGLDVSKIICLILGTYLIKEGTSTFIIAGFVSLAFYIILSAISWAAGWGFTLIVTQNFESKAFQQNSQIRALEASVEDANNQVKRLSRYADETVVNQAQSQINAIKLEVNTLWDAPATNSLGQRTGNTVRSQLGGVCPGATWYHKKYCPQILATQAKTQPYQDIIDNHTAYLSAVKHKNNMLKELGNAEYGGMNPNSYMHPLFIGMATLLDTPAQLVKYRLLLLTSAMIELLGGLFFVIGLILKNKQSYSIEEIVAIEQQKHKLLADLGVNVIELGKNEYTKIGNNNTAKTKS